jgi:hypothetical protein
MPEPTGKPVAGQSEAPVSLRPDERERLTLLVERYQRAQIPGWELVGKLLAEAEALEVALRAAVPRLTREDLAAIRPDILRRLLMPPGRTGRPDDERKPPK